MNVKIKRVHDTRGLLAKEEEKKRKRLKGKEKCRVFDSEWREMVGFLVRGTNWQETSRPSSPRA